MNETVLLTDPDVLAGYDEDLYLWTRQQAALLRAQSGASIDWENLAEEIESLGRRHRHELESRLRVLILHLLKWSLQPEHRCGSWGSSIKVQRRDIEKHLREAPSLRREVPAMCVAEYELVLLRAVSETGLPLSHFPAELPFDVADIMAEGWLPGRPTVD